MGKTAAIQVGFAALRTPSGAFKKSVPIYMPETPTLAAREKAVLEAAEKDIAPLVKDYIEKQRRLSKQKGDPEDPDEDEEDLPWWQK